MTNRVAGYLKGTSFQEDSKLFTYDEWLLYTRTISYGTRWIDSQRAFVRSYAMLFWLIW